MAKPFIIFVLLFLGFQGHAQQVPTVFPLEQNVPAIPATQTKTTTTLAHYINSHFKTPQQKVTAIYYWLAKYVAYDIEGLAKAPAYFEKQSLISQTLETRKALCQGYAEVFQELCEKTGLTAYLITGMATPAGSVIPVAHAWNAVQLKGEWFLFDVTWGAGYVENGLFVPRLNQTYFMVPPKSMIRNHKPFDPLWQFLVQPLTYSGQLLYKPTPLSSKVTFAYKDTLAAYEASSFKEKLVGTIRRIETQPSVNSLVLFQLNHLKKQLSVVLQNEAIQEYNTAVSVYNQSIEYINSFIRYRNNRFQPIKTDTELKKMASASQEKLTACKQRLIAIKPQANLNLLISIQELNLKLDKALTQIAEQQNFVERYLKTPIAQRSTLFYKNAVAGQ